ncbi:hypothetical protein MKW98_010037 [Papaver atlanticum]|uniref:Uncharacterized protein n=1 Tax=Papaver atlanticum TaxID=357466 RepID=A0AAD4RXD3_9MAGN|nr:hypothetical protein MKW98_010037 [Papaver atlanticum]
MILCRFEIIEKTGPWSLSVTQPIAGNYYPKASERRGYGGERYEQLEFQKKVAQHYEMLHHTWKSILNTGLLLNCSLFVMHLMYASKSFQKRRWGSCWSGYWFFGAQRNRKRIGHVVLTPEPMISGKIMRKEFIKLALSIRHLPKKCSSDLKESS